MGVSQRGKVIVILDACAFVNCTSLLLWRGKKERDNGSIVAFCIIPTMTVAMTCCLSLEKCAWAQKSPGRSQLGFSGG